MAGKFTAPEVGLKQVKRIVRARRTLVEGLNVDEDAAILIRERGIFDAGKAAGVDLMIELMMDPDVEGPEVE